MESISNQFHNNEQNNRPDVTACCIHTYNIANRQNASNGKHNSLGKCLRKIV